MVKLNNYNGVVTHFVLLLTFLFVISCAEKKYAVTKIVGKEIGVTETNLDIACSSASEKTKQIEIY